MVKTAMLTAISEMCTIQCEVILSDYTLLLFNFNGNNVQLDTLSEDAVNSLDE